MGFCFYKKIIYICICAMIFQLFLPAISLTAFASYIVWPSELNMYDDSVVFDDIVATTSTASNSKKGFLFTGDPKEIFTLGAGHVAINLTLSGRGHAIIQYLEGLKKRGVKITLILINDKAPVGTNPSLAPELFRKPYCYLLDFHANNGEWQKYNFDRVVNEYVDYVDNWVIGNEINSQLYGFYGAATMKEYTKRYCDTFKEVYKKIKDRNENANLYISFEQAWDLPALSPKNKMYDAETGKYRYNASEQLEYINAYLPREMDWGVALHPYPTPIESGKFWGGDFTGYDYNDEVMENRPYLTTLKNFEVAIAFLAQKPYLKKDGSVRNIIISEVGITSQDGEEIQAAGLYYLWEKIRNNDYIKFFLYNAQNDVPDGFNFGLTSDKKKKRLAWAVFKDMDNDECNGWCKDLLDRVLEEYGYIDIDGVITQIATESEIVNEEASKSNVIFQSAEDK